MIDARELRIGNLVNGITLGKKIPVVVEGIHKNGINPHVDSLGELDVDWYFDRIEPIPLSPEILEKCGFEENNFHSDHWYHVELGPHIIEYDDGTYILEAVSGASVSNCFKYLHQLQNLYFALTGQELNYNP